MEWVDCILGIRSFMYRIKLWDEDKWNIHSSSYNSSKYGSNSSNGKNDDKNYHEQKYGSKGKNVSSDYMKREDAKEKEENKIPGLFENLEDEKKEQDIKEDEIPFKAAKQVFDEKSQNEQIGEEKNIKTIEDAIKKAIEEEKELIIIDD